MFDQYDDTSCQQLYKFRTVICLPEFVKTASISDATEISSLRSDAFGDPAKRKFPLHNKADAWLSRLYFTKQASEYAAPVRAIVMERINKAAKMWDLDAEYTLVSQEKVASETYSINVPADDGSLAEKWDLVSPRDLEKAALHIFENKASYAYPQRKAIARGILNCDLRKEANIDADIVKYLEKAAGYGMCTKKGMLETMQDRVVIYETRDEDLADKMAKMAEVVAEEEVTPALLSKVAAAIDICDRNLGLYVNYRRGNIATPEENLFQVTEKIAEELQNSVIPLQNGKSVPSDAVTEALLDNYFNNVVGEPIEGSVSEKIAALKALPAPDANDFMRYANLEKKAYNMSTSMQKHASTASAISAMFKTAGDTSEELSPLGRLIKVMAVHC